MRVIAWSGFAVSFGTTYVGAQSNYAAPYTFVTLAGTAGLYGSADGTGAAARFTDPQGVAVDLIGAAYVADTFSQTIRKVTPQGVVTTLAGTPGVHGAADGTGGNAEFNYPGGIAVDFHGTVYVSDTDNATIRKISSSGVVTTLAGTPGNLGSADGTGAAAQFDAPSGIAVDSQGNLYVADTANSTIRKITPMGAVTTLAGSPGVVGEADGIGAAASFDHPYGTAVDASGNVYVADTGNNGVRKITSAGVVTTLAGGSPGATSPGYSDGTGRAARFYSPMAVAVDANGNVYVADSGNSLIREISASGVVTTLGGRVNPLSGEGVMGAQDGTGSAATFGNVDGIASDPSGNIVLADTGNGTLRTGVPAAPVAPSILIQPMGETVYPGSQVVLSVSAAGIPEPSFQWMLGGSAISGATGATLTIPNVQPANGGNYTVAVSNSAGSVTSAPAPLVEVPQVGYQTAPYASVNANSLAIDAAGNVYASIGNAIETITGGVSSIVAGNAAASGYQDGAGAAARFSGPSGIATDHQGNVYVADSGNNAVRRVTPGGIVSTLAGGLGSGAEDGKGQAAQFNNPTSVAVDFSGNVFVVDSGNDSLREIAPDGSTSTVLSASAFHFDDNHLSFGSPLVYNAVSYTIKGVAVDTAGTPYVSVSIYFGGEYYAVAALKVTGAGAFQVLFENDGAVLYFRIPPFDAASSEAIVVDKGGNVYVGINEGIMLGNEGIYSANGGNTLSEVPINAFAADARGLLYVAEPQGVFLVSPVGTLPSITTQPQGGAIGPGGTATLEVVASGAPDPAYQWQLDGTDIPGAQSATLANSAPGSYTVVVTNAAGSSTSAPALVTIGTRLTNLSSRANVGTASNIEIAGFVVAGPPQATEQVLVRGAGPALSQFGVAGVLSQPSLALFDSAGNQIASNTGWASAPDLPQLDDAVAATGAFAFASGSADAALVADLAPGAYTVQVSGVNASEGVALAEVYDVTKGFANLVNISTRAFVGTGANVEIAGIVVAGPQPLRVLARAVGPSLSQFGVSGPLLQPSLAIVDAAGNVVASNTGWSTNANAAMVASESSSVGAFPLPSQSADCALLVTLQPGEYTAVVSGVGGATGVALVEVYQTP